MVMEVELPDGSIVEFPDGTTDDVINKALSGIVSDAPSGFIKGLRDPVDALSQIAYNTIPESWQKSGNNLNNWLADKGLPLQRMGEGGVNQQIKENEAAYQSQRKASGETGMDWDRLAGNVFNPVNLYAASKVPAALMKSKPLMTSAVTGAGFGAMQPVTQGDFWTEKGKQAGIGAVAGPVTQKAVSGVSRVIQPKVSAAVQKMKESGITPTMGQSMGGMFQKLEDKMLSAPIVGDAIAHQRNKGMEDFNRAVFDRVLAPIGKKFPKELDIGRDGYKYVKSQVNQAYDDLLPKLSGDMDNQFSNVIDKLKTMAPKLGEQNAKRFANLIDDEVIGKFTKYGKASGATLKEIESKLGQEIRSFSKSQNPYDGDYARAVTELQAQLRAMIERSNPGQSGQLKAANEAFANFNVLRNAASMRGAKEGVFTPAQLGGASWRSDFSKGRGRTAEGNALMQDLSDAAENVLGSKVPNSGTVDRLLPNSLLAGAGYIEPNLLLAAGIGAAPYLGPMQKGINALLTSRPQSAQPVAEAVKRIAPFLIPGTTAAGYGLLNPPK